MTLDFELERRQAHALLDLLPMAKLGAIRSLFEVMVHDDDGDKELTKDDRRAILDGLESSEKHGTVAMEQVLAHFEMTMAELRRWRTSMIHCLRTSKMAKRPSGSTEAWVDFLAMVKLPG